MTYPIPPDTRTVGSGNPPQDMNQLSDVAGVLAQAVALLAGTAGNAVPAGNVTNMAAVQAFLAAGAQGQATVDGHLSSGVMPRPALYNAQHLRRWRAAYAMADRTVVPVVMCGDSIFNGTGADGTTSTTQANCVANGICGRLQGLFNASPRTLQVVNVQGFLPMGDPRVVMAGGASQANYVCTALGQGWRLIAATETLTFTIPTGVTSISVVQGNTSASFNTGHSGVADVTGLYNINAGGNIALSALTGTNNPLPSTPIAVTAGQVFQVVGPATAQTYISGFILGNGAANGVKVHRVCQGGLVSGTLLGGQNSGVIQNNLWQSGAFNVNSMQAQYLWAPTPGVILVEYGINDQTFQSGGGTGSQNDVTLALYQSWIQQFCTQAVADGWCVLLVGSGRNNTVATPSTLDQYYAAMHAISNATDHVAFIDVGEMWGAYAASQALGLQVTADQHPSEAGHGDIAAMIYMALNGQVSSGITELAAG